MQLAEAPIGFPVGVSAPPIRWWVRYGALRTGQGGVLGVWRWQVMRAGGCVIGSRAGGRLLRGDVPLSEDWMVSSWNFRRSWGLMRRLGSKKRCSCATIRLMAGSLVGRRIGWRGARAGAKVPQREGRY